MAKVTSEDDLDPVRRRLVERARAKGVTLADLSRAAGKNLSYVHQFIWKGAPKSLPLAVRIQVAKALDMPVDSLSPPGEPSLASIVGDTEAPGGGARSGGELRDVPVFRDDGVIDPAQAAEWTTGLKSTAYGGIYIALWITGTRGRLQPGDLAYVHMLQPPRVGDTALALAERRVVALGTLVSADSVVAIRDAEDKPRKFPAKDVQLAKVIAVRFP
ncbi:hypothetical protein [Neoroseomonas oryzicola]|uniref:Uncharacterized protein n=1 Tax=Neoroseomonas oryzicola TaxID=535904 RepID=A0A9X9WPH5_9PROT|nr:hypothetical protein [Neoroseomonas oryzicola]MBR0662235.1 hypothetical protein [Neoroseomonas oryzicola]NKE19757.1 hypothetical protein [Neoroseomonas oryzicola]